jgi:hypothetical protein
VAAHIRFSNAVAEVLKHRPNVGALFPYLATVSRGMIAPPSSKQRCTGLWDRRRNVAFVPLRLGERARACGYPEREAREALGITARPFTRAYAKKAHVTVRALDEFEHERKVFERVVSDGDDRGIATVRA